MLPIMARHQLKSVRRARLELVGGDKRNLRNEQRSENSENGGEDNFWEISYPIYLGNVPYTAKRLNNQNGNHTNTMTKYCFIAPIIERVKMVRIG